VPSPPPMKWWSGHLLLLVLVVVLVPPQPARALVGPCTDEDLDGCVGHIIPYEEFNKAFPVIEYCVSDSQVGTTTTTTTAPTCM